ncbi:MAG TPA: GAF domain-containing protein, partial [Gaiellaceae bacterium]
MGTHELAGADQLRRRDHQQALVAELGRSALTGTPLAQVVADAVSAVADGLHADRVAVFEPTPDGAALAATITFGWPPGHEQIPVDADTPVARTFRDQNSTAAGSLVAAPIRGDAGLVGVLAAGADDPLSPDDTLFLRSVANLVAAVMARDRAEERRRHSEEALGFLAEAGHLLAENLDYDTTLATLADLVVPRLADWCIVDLAEDDGTMRRVAVRAADPRKQRVLGDLHREYPPVIGSGQPAGRALSDGTTVHFPAFTPETLRETTLDDRHFELMTELDPRSAMAVPLVAQGRVLGALTFAWSESGHRYDESDTVLAEELGRRAAVAIENARLYRSELEAQRRIAFLVEASDVLASSLDYDETLTALARLAVPRLGDWCVIYIVGLGGTIERRAVEHAGGRQDIIRNVLEAHPIRPDAQVGIPAVVRTGRSELNAIASPMSTAADVEAPEQLAGALEEIRVHSTMCVPLIARRHTLGAILFVSAESERVFTEADLQLAEDLAARAAVAVDNSRLFKEAEQRAEASEALDSIADGVFLVDAHGTIRLWNAAAETITGLGPAEVRGRPAASVFEGWEQIAAVAGATASTFPVTIEGRELWLSISGVPSSDGTAHAFRDVTADRQLDRLKSDFV